MRSADIITASLLTAVGLLVLGEAIRLGFRWGPDGPQSGFFPFWLALILIGHSVAIIVRAIRRHSEKPFVDRTQLRSVLTVAVPAAAMVLITQFFGLYLAAALYLGFYVRWVGRHSWFTALAIAVCVPVVTFVVFERWFLVPLPKGPVEAWLGY
jgi:putative tricarboxylic transport membrane protein